MNILITGSTGFLASHLIPLLEQDYSLYLSPERTIYDLRKEAHVEKLLIHSKPKIIIHLAADVGGLQYNLDNPASIYYNNVLMNTLLIDRAAVFGVKKFIFVSSVCAYPHYPTRPTKEHHLWNGYPEPSNGSYGISKRIALTQLEVYRDQFGMQFEYPILANLYGPGDKSDHVIPMLIEKFLKEMSRSAAELDIIANGRKVEVWGDGSQTRDFLYARDAARVIAKLVETDIGDTVNIARGFSVPIKALVAYLKELTEFEGKIVWSMDKPTGQIHRQYNTDRAKELLEWQAETSLKDGLRETIRWMAQQD